MTNKFNSFFYICLLSVVISSFIFIYPAKSEENSQISDKNKLFNAESFILENGMQVIVIPNHKIPAVTHMIWYKVGAADEPVGKSGIAHFFEHLMFKGTKEVKAGEFSKIVKSLGGNDNAFTSQDYTAYFQSLPSEHLEVVMKMEADRMNNLAPPLEDFVSERKVIIEERHKRTDNNPQGRFMEHFKSLLFINHPYSIPVIGWKHEIENLDWETAKNFYDKWYAPNNAFVVISGDITLEKAKELAKKTYGKLPAEEIPVRNRTKVPPLSGIVKLEYKDINVKQPLWVRGYRVASNNQNIRESLALQVLEELMAGNPASRLYKDMVVDKKMASSVSMSYNGYAINDGTLMIYAEPIDISKLEDINKEIDRQIKKLIDEGISEEELTETKNRLIDASIYARDSLAGPAMIIGNALASGQKLVDIEYWTQAINSIKEEDVINVATKYLSSDNNYVLGYLLPEKEGE